MKLKICSKCQKQTRLWKSKPPLCKPCAMRYGDKHHKEKDNSVTGLKKAPVRKVIRPVSDKQAQRLKEYHKVRDSYMKEHPFCEAHIEDICHIKATDLHHRAGKVGKLLTDTRYFMALCRYCHSAIELAPEWAKEKGYSLNRLDK